MADAFEMGGQGAWFHDQGHWAGFFHTYDQFQLGDFGAYFSQPRKVHVLLPRDYEVSQDRYPVLYCNDGEEIFFPDGASGESWQVAELLSQLYLRDELQKVIVVAICTGGDRHYEYSHIPTDGGGLIPYSRYLAKGIKPFIDTHYRTQSDQTLLLGSAQGGLAAFYTACQHPRQFPQVAALSPAFWFSLDRHPAEIKGLDTAFKLPLQSSALLFALTPTLENAELRPKIYLDWGLQEDWDNHYESRTKTRAREMRRLLIEEFDYQENRNLFTIEDPIGSHSVASWRGRLPRILQLFF